MRTKVGQASCLSAVIANRPRPAHAGRGDSQDACPTLTVRKFVPAFTLIELLAVMTIIAILVGMVIGIAGYAQRKAARSQTEVEIKSLESAIEAFKLDQGFYPTSSATRSSSDFSVEKTNCWLLYRQVVLGSNALSKPYLTTLTAKQIQSSGILTYIIDPYGNPYNYYCRTDNLGSQTNKVSFDLWSYGADGLSSAAADLIDDINNWK